MKKKIINAIILILFAAVTLLFGINASWACTYSPIQKILSETEPNEPDPEIAPMYFFSDADPNVPDPE